MVGRGRRERLRPRGTRPIGRYCTAIGTLNKGLIRWGQTVPPVKTSSAPRTYVPKTSYIARTSHVAKLSTKLQWAAIYVSSVKRLIKLPR